MFKVLPQMKRLAAQVCERYGIEIAAVIVEKENVGVGGEHIPYYIAKLKPNPWGYDYLSCRPFKGRRGEHSASINNVTDVLITCTPAGPIYDVAPSWRGYLIPEGEVDARHYNVRRGYMLLTVGIDFIEQSLINAFEGRRAG